ncbi:MAG: RNA polymerase sigma factor [Ruminococcus sp.]
MDGNQLVKKARAGDREAFASLYIQYKDSLYRYAYYKLRSAEDAKDAVSSCITQAYMGIGGIRDEKAFSSWLFRILYRECCAMIRKKTQLEFVEIDENRHLIPHNTYIRSELSEALDALPTEDRDIVLLSVVAGWNSKEISALFGMKPATVRSRLSRALGKMRQFLE